jgi:hypothetical protein
MQCNNTYHPSTHTPMLCTPDTSGIGWPQTAIVLAALGSRGMWWSAAGNGPHASSHCFLLLGNAVKSLCSFLNWSASATVSLSFSHRSDHPSCAVHPVVRCMYHRSACSLSSSVSPAPSATARADTARRDALVPVAGRQAGRDWWWFAPARGRLPARGLLEERSQQQHAALGMNVSCTQGR